MKKTPSPALNATAIAVGLYALSCSALAQEAASKAELETVIVTAQKVKENPQKVPLSITSIGSEALADAGVKNILNLQSLVTSVNIIDQGPGASVQIRGVGSNPGGGNVDPSAAFSVDGVYQSRSGGAFGSMYDLARVEVLKGPQGTLYGRNATVGALNVVSANPTKFLEGRIEGELGNYQMRRGSVMLNVPLNDQVQVRFAGQAVKRNGFLSDGYNDADDQAGRFKVLFTPDATSSLLVTMDMHHKAGNGQGNIFTGTVTTTGTNNFGLIPAGGTFTQTHTPMRDNPGNPWQLNPNLLTSANLGQGGAFSGTGSAANTGHAEPANQGLNIQNEGFTAEYNKDFGGATLTVIPAFRTSYSLNQGGTGGNVVFPAYNLINQEQTSLEMRLASTQAGPLRWIGGLFYLNEDAPTLTAGRAQTGANTTFTNMTDVNAKSTAAFGQLTYSIVPSTRVVGGLRYTRDEKRQDGRIYQVNGVTVDPNASNYTVTGAPISAAGKYASNSVDYKLGVDTDLAKNTMAYANVSTGYKAGGLNFDGANGARQTFDPEKLLAFALGGKHRGLGNRLQLNGELFLWRYKNQQIAVLDQLDAPNSLRNSAFSNLLFKNNSGTSKIFGFDLDAIYKATPEDRINASLTYMRARNGQFVTDQTVGGAIVIPGPVNIGSPAFQASTDLTGQVMPFSPTWQLNLGYSHIFVFGNGATLTAATDWHAETHSYVNYNLFSPERQSGYTKGNLSLNFVTPSGNTSVMGYVRNVTNVAVLTRGSVLGSTGGTIAHYAGIMDPRTYGVVFTQKF